MIMYIDMLVHEEDYICKYIPKKTFLILMWILKQYGKEKESPLFFFFLTYSDGHNE